MLVLKKRSWKAGIYWWQVQVSLIFPCHFPFQACERKVLKSENLLYMLQEKGRLTYF